MKYRKLGKTGLRVSEISFGTIPILSGNVPVLPDYYSPDEETAISIMEYAYQLGCNLYDTAIVPEYGDAEIKLGKFAKRIGRKHIIISDKARFFEGNEMYEAVMESCENLETYADIYFVHQVDEDKEDITFQKGGAIDALTELKMQGKIRFVGIASHYYSILLRGAKDKRVDVLQGSGNILERGMLDRIEKEACFLQKGFLLNKVYAAGILPSFFKTSTLLSGVLSYPISSALIGIGTMEQAECAMKEEIEVCRRPSFEEVIAVLERNFKPIPCDRCQKCQCIFGTEIHILFRQYNYYFLGKDYWALRKLNLGIRESAKKCKECTEMPCIKQCPQNICIPQVMKKVEKLMDFYYTRWINE